MAFTQFAIWRLFQHKWKLREALQELFSFPFQLKVPTFLTTWLLWLHLSRCLSVISWAYQEETTRWLAAKQTVSCLTALSRTHLIHFFLSKWDKRSPWLKFPKPSWWRTFTFSQTLQKVLLFYSRPAGHTCSSLSDKLHWSLAYNISVLVSVCCCCSFWLNCNLWNSNN